ncbi:MAG: type II toxin-antitoxin system HicB family antitoxin [archaeon]
MEKANGKGKGECKGKVDFTISIKREGKWYVAHCVELDVASQGRTVDEAHKNIKEAVQLYLEENPEQVCLLKEPVRIESISTYVRPSHTVC